MIRRKRNKKSRVINYTGSKSLLNKVAKINSGSAFIIENSVFNVLKKYLNLDKDEAVSLVYRVVKININDDLKNIDSMFSFGRVFTIKNVPVKFYVGVIKQHIPPDGKKSISVIKVSVKDTYFVSSTRDIEKNISDSISDILLS